MKLKTTLSLMIASLFIFFFATVRASAQTPGTTQYPTSLDTSTSLPRARDLTQSTLSAGIDNSVTTFTVVSGTGFTSPAIVWIDAEQINCTTVSTNTFSGCTRGAGTTSAASHLSGTAVQLRPSAVYINGLQDAILKIQTLLGTNASDTHPASDKVPVGISASGFLWKQITNAQIDSAAAIAYSKLNLTGAILNADLAGSIANNKLANSTISGKALGTNLDALTIGTGLSGTSYNGSTGVTIAVNPSQNITTLSNLTTNGFVKTSGGTGALSVDTTSYVPTTRTVNGKDLSTNQTLGLASSDFANQGTTTTLLHGNGSGNPSFGQVVNADITNSTIDLTTKVTGVLPVANGGNKISVTKVTSQFDKTTDTTLANVTGLTFNVTGGETYTFRAVLFVTLDATGLGKLAIAGTATATTVQFDGTCMRSAQSNALSLGYINSLGTATSALVSSAVKTVVIEGMIVVNAGGTLTVQFAQSASNGTSSVLAGSFFTLVDTGS